MITYPTKIQARQNFPGDTFPGGNYFYNGTWYHLVKNQSGYSFVPRTQTSPLSFGTFKI